MSAESYAEWLEEARAEAERAEAAIQRVRALHVREVMLLADGTHWQSPKCASCEYVMPCPTLAALDSTDPVEAAPRAVIVSDGRGGKTIAEEHDVDLPRGQAAAIRRSDRQPTRGGTHPDVPAPGRAGRFETLLGAEHEQFDQRGELLRSVVEYMDAPSGTVSAPAPGRSGEEHGLERPAPLVRTPPAGDDVVEPGDAD